MSLVLTALASLLAAAWLTQRVRAYAISHQLIDSPSPRGLSRVAVPRGGGLAIVLVVASAMMVHGENINEPRFWGLWGGAWAFAGLGWTDDRRALGALTKLILQLVFAVFVVAAVTSFSGPPSAGHGFVLLMVVVVAVWFVNLYNFMDGADGFAATHATVTASAATVLLAYSGAWSVAAISAALAGASAGFLCWNWPPAKIFLGDVGSYFLGFMFIVLAIEGPQELPWACAWLILHAPFIVDASLTLLRRLAGGAKWTQPHRAHVYQRLIRNGMRVETVVRALIAVHVFALIPLAASAVINPEIARLNILLGYGITVTIWIVGHRCTVHLINS